jgi:hypothetical protein
MSPITRSRLSAAAALLAALALHGGAHALTPPADLAAGTCVGQCGAIAGHGDVGASPAGSAAYGYVTTNLSEAYGVSPVALDPNSRGGGVETNGSKWVSASFQANAGDPLDMWFNYVSTDGKGYDDYAWARVVDASSGSLVAWLFTAVSTNSGSKNIVPGDVVDKSEFDPDEVIVNFKDFDFISKDASDPVDWTPLGWSNGTCWKDNAEGCGSTGWLQSHISFAQAGTYRVEVGVVNWGDGAYDSGLAFDYRGLVSSVPEPGSVALMLAGLGIVGLAGRRRQARD